MRGPREPQRAGITVLGRCRGAGGPGHSATRGTTALCRQGNPHPVVWGVAVALGHPPMGERWRLCL